MMVNNVQIETGWKEVLANEFVKPYFKQIKQSLLADRSAGKVIFPPGPFIFNAFNSTPFDQVRVVILGQDPYHQPNQAMGLSFSVPKGIRIPASLVNIYKELQADIGIQVPSHGDLSGWASQGVFLLNAFLTVRQGEPGAHQKIGWHLFTDAVISSLSKNREHLVFMLWGNFAKSKKVLIDEQRHLVLESAHPSPLAGNKFAGCKHFSKANGYLEKHGLPAINWGNLI